MEKRNSDKKCVYMRPQMWVYELQPETVTPTTVTMTATITFGGSSSTTRALTAGGVKTFAEGDRIAVVYKDINGLTQKAVTAALESEDIHEEGTKANITVTLSDPAPDGALRYIYPAAMALASVPTDAQIDDAGTIAFTNLDAQDGTLDTLASTLDLAVFDGTLTGEAALPASVTLDNRLTILELTLKNADASFNITRRTKSLTVSDGQNTYVVTPPAPATSFDDGPIYVIMRPVETDATLSFTANGGVPKVVTGKLLEAGHIYPVGLRLGKLVNLCDITEEDENGYFHYTAQHGDVLYGDFNEGYVTIADGATVTLAYMTIERPYQCHHAILEGLGDATILLAEDSENYLHSSPDCYASAIFVPSGKTLTIDGPGLLFASAEGCEGAAIGGGFNDDTYEGIHCGTIIIDGGVIEAKGGKESAGIGSGRRSSCDDILIRGGIIRESVGGQNAAGIGCGSFGSCGDIIIGPGITYVKAKKKGSAPHHIGSASGGSCGTVTVAPELDDSGEDADERIISQRFDY